MRKSLSAICKTLILHGLSLGALTAAACSSESAVGAGQGEYTLTVTPPTGGTITSADGSIHCPGQCELSRPEGTLLQLTATPESGALFELWTEGCKGLIKPTCEVAFVKTLTAAARFISCTDQLQNGTETGIDCGGSVCDPCPAGQACQINADCAAGLTCAGGTCTVQCNASSVQVLGSRSPTITPATAPAGGSANVLCRYPTYQLLMDTVVVQDFTTNNASKANQQISCHSDGAWYAPNGERFNTLNCVGFAPCSGCALPGMGSGVSESM